MDLISLAIANKNKPGLTTPQKQSDWNQTDTLAKDFIKNKPVISNSIKDDNNTEIPTVEAVKIFHEEQIPNVVENANISEYYAIDIFSLEELKLASVDVLTSVIVSSGYYSVLSVGIAFAAAVVADGKAVNVINAPFDFAYLGTDGFIWTNQDNFTRIGIINPALSQLTGIEGVVWMDALKQIHDKTLNNSTEIIFGLEETSDIAVMQFVLTGRISSGSSIHSGVKYLAALWQQAFSDPETRLVFEYKKQDKVKQHYVSLRQDFE